METMIIIKKASYGKVFDYPCDTLLPGMHETWNFFLLLALNGPCRRGRGVIMPLVILRFGLILPLRACKLEANSDIKKMNHLPLSSDELPEHMKISKEQKQPMHIAPSLTLYTLLSCDIQGPKLRFVLIY